MDKSPAEYRIEELRSRPVPDVEPWEDLTPATRTIPVEQEESEDD